MIPQLSAWDVGLEIIKAHKPTESCDCMAHGTATSCQLGHLEGVSAWGEAGLPKVPSVPRIPSICSVSLECDTVWQAASLCFSQGQSRWHPAAPRILQRDLRVTRLFSPFWNKVKWGVATLVCITEDTAHRWLGQYQCIRQMSRWKEKGFCFCL